MLHSFFIPFAAIILAEMLDKSQLTIMFLATQTKRSFPIIIGSIFAFILVDGIAVVFGSVIANLIPKQIITIAAGIAFITFGLLSFRKADTSVTKKVKAESVFISSFFLVFLSEWGDKTQLATAAFATQFEPIPVFLGVIGAMSILTILAVYIGRFLAKHIKKDLIQKVAGIAFILIGLSLFIFP